MSTLSAQTRKLLVGERIRAMQWGGESAIQKLDKFRLSRPVEEAMDCFSVLMLKAEILRLEERYEESANCLSDAITLSGEKLSFELRIAATENLVDVQFQYAPVDGFHSHNWLIDERRRKSFSTSDAESLFAAQESIESGRLAEAQKLLRQSLSDAYLVCSWHSMRKVSSRLVRMFLSAGDYVSATHYLITGETSEAITDLAVGIARRRDKDLISTIVNRIVTFGNLQKHVLICCTLLEAISSSISDHDVHKIALWLVSRCRQPYARNGGGVMKAAWKLVKVIGWRLPEDVCKTLVQVAFEHPEWKAPIPGGNQILIGREVLLESILPLATRYPQSDISNLVQPVLEVAVDRIQNHDYRHAINLICAVAERGSKQEREKIRKRLFPTGVKINSILAQVATLFEVEPLSADLWKTLATAVAADLRLSTQRLVRDASPKSVGETFMTMTYPMAEGTIVVTAHGLTRLHALARNAATAAKEDLEMVILSVVEAIQNEDNLFTNRSSLLDVLSSFVDAMTVDFRNHVIEQILSLARGEISVSAVISSADSSGDPFSSFRANFGSKRQVQAYAIRTTASLSRYGASSIVACEEILIEECVSPDSELRRSAYAAARYLPHLSGERLLPIIMGLRDSDANAAVAAFASIRQCRSWSLTRPMWKMFLLATALAGQSIDPTLRQAAAACLQSRYLEAPTAPIRSEAVRLLNLFKEDIDAGVRAACKEPAGSV